MHLGGGGRYDQNTFYTGIKFSKNRNMILKETIGCGSYPHVGSSSSRRPAKTYMGAGCSLLP